MYQFASGLLSQRTSNSIKLFGDSEISIVEINDINLDDVQITMSISDEDPTWGTILCSVPVVNKLTLTITLDFETPVDIHGLGEEFLFYDTEIESSISGNAVFSENENLVYQDSPEFILVNKNEICSLTDISTMFVEYLENVDVNDLNDIFWKNYYKNNKLRNFEEVGNVFVLR